MSTVPYPAANLFPMKYATIWRRFWAALLDFLVLLPILAVSIYTKRHIQNSFLLVCCIIVSYSYANVYMIWMHSRTGQTLGKMVTGVRVLDKDELWTPTLREAFLMNIGNVVYSLCLMAMALYAVASHTYSQQGFLANSAHKTLTHLLECWIVADFICIFCNRKRRSLHDLIAGTVVVRDRDYVLELGLRLQSNPTTYPAVPE